MEPQPPLEKSSIPACQLTPLLWHPSGVRGFMAFYQGYRFAQPPANFRQPSRLLFCEALLSIKALRNPFC